MGKFLDGLTNFGNNVAEFGNNLWNEISGTFNGDIRRENQALQQAAVLQQQEYSTNAAQQAMDFTAQQNDLAYERQKELRATTYQDTVKDLKAAGLNPILAMNNGGSATPSVSAGSGVMAETQKAEVDTTSQLYNILGAVIAGISVASKIPGKKTGKIGFG